MIFRSYQSKDKEKCLELFRSNLPKFFASYEEAEFTNFLDENRDNYFVLERDDMLIGCGGYGIKGTTAYLVWGMVHNTQHGTGVGKRLLLERLGLITRHREIREIVVDTSQHTYGFFEKLGFSVTKVTTNGYGENLHRYDMKLSLDEGSRELVKKSLLRIKGFPDSIINQQKEND